MIMRLIFRPAIFALAVLASAPLALTAADRVWDGLGADDFWSTGLNWGGTAPAVGDALLFNGSTRLTPDNDLLADSLITGITFNSEAGLFTLAGNRITLGGNVLNSSSVLQTINLDMILASTRTFTGGTPGLSVGGSLSGVGGLNTSGNVTLTVANSYDGLTTVASGSALNIQHNNALGATAGGTTVAAGGVLQLQGGTTVTGEALTLNGVSAGNAQPNGLLNISGNNEWAGSIQAVVGTTNGLNTRISSASGTLTVSGAITISGAVSSTAALVLTGSGNGVSSGGISGSGAGVTLIKTGTGIWTLAVANTYTGQTRIDVGVLRLDHANALPGGIGNTGGSSNLNLNGGVIGLGVGDFTRALGTGADQVQWAASGSGGFAAFGADRVVNLGGASATLVWAGSGSFLTTGVLVLGATGADATVDFQNHINLNGAARTVRVDNGTADVDAEISGDLTGTGGALTKMGNGTLLLSGSNSYDGVTTLSAGVLRVGHANALGTTAGGASVASAAVLDLNGFTLGAEAVTINGTGISSSGALINSNTSTAASLSGVITLGANSSVGGAGDLTLSNTVQGAFTLTKVGAGTLHLSGDNTHTGITTVSAGILRLGHSNALGTTAGGTSVTSGAVLDLNGQSISAEAVTINGTGIASGGALINSSTTNPASLSGVVTLGSASSIGAAGNVTLSGGLTGNFNLTKLGTGTLTLTTAATRAGSGTITTTINSGVLRIENANAYSTGTSALAIINSGATLELAGGIIHNQPITLNDGGTVRSDGSNTEQGKITIASAAVVTLATVAAADVFTVGNGSNDISGGAGATLRFSGPGTIHLSQASDYTGNYSVDGGTLRLQTTGTSLGATNTATLTLNGGNLTGFHTANLSFTGGAGNNVILAAPTATITSDVSASGAGITYTFGRLNIGASQLNILGGANVASGTAAVTFNNATTLSGNATFNVTPGAAGAALLTLSGAVSDGGGAYGITKTGTGTLTLSGAAANTFTGLTSLQGGQINLGKTGGVNAIAGNLSITGSGAALNFVSSGAQDQIADTAAVTLNGPGSVLGQTAANFGIIVAGNNVTETIGSLTVTDGMFNAGVGTWTITGAGIFDGTNGDTRFFVTSGGALSFGSLSLIGMNGAATATSEDSFAVNGNNVVQSTITVGAGGLTLNGSRIMLNHGNSGSRLVLDGNLTTTGSTASIIQLGTTGSGTSPVELSSTTGDHTRTFTIGGGGADLTINRNITNGAATTAGIIKEGTGTLTLSGINTYTGNTTISTGALSIATIGALAGWDTNGRYSVASGATLAVYNAVSDASITTLLGTTNFAAGSRLGLDTTSGNRTYAGILTDTAQGALGLHKLGNNTLTLTGASTYTGATVVSAGTLQIGNAGSIADSSSISIASGAVLMTNRTGTVTLAQAISGEGSLTVSGSGTTVLSGATANTYSGSTTVSAGVLSLAKTGGVTAVAGDLTISGSGDVIFAAAGTQDQIANTTAVLVNGTAGTSGSTINGTGANLGNITVTETIGSISVLNGNFNTGFASVWGVNGAGVFDGTGAADVRFIGNSASQISFGSLSLTAMTGTTVVSSPDSFVLGGSQSAVTTVSVGSGGLSLDGSRLVLNQDNINGGSRLVLDGNVTTTGTAASFIQFGTASAGVATLQLSSTTGSHTRTFNTGGGGADLTVNVVITNGTATTAGIIKEGSGTLTLAGANSYTGTTIVTSGALQVGSAGVGRTGTGAVTVDSDGAILGTGVVQGTNFTAQSGSTIHAGDGTAAGDLGTLTFTPVSGSGSIDFQSGSNVNLCITPGGTSDQLKFIGTGSNTLLFNSNLTIGPASFTPIAGEVFQLLDWSGLSSAPTFAAHFTNNLIRNGSADNGSAWDLPDISSAPEFFWDLSNFTNNGSIAIVVIPEPSRAVLLLFGVLGFLLRRRRA